MWSHSFGEILSVYAVRDDTRDVFVRTLGWEARSGFALTKAQNTNSRRPQLRVQVEENSLEVIFRCGKRGTDYH